MLNHEHTTKQADENRERFSLDVTAFKNSHQRYLGGFPALVGAGSLTLRAALTSSGVGGWVLSTNLHPRSVTQSQGSAETSVQSALRQAAVSSNLPPGGAEKISPNFVSAYKEAARSAARNSTEVM